MPAVVPDMAKSAHWNTRMYFRTREDLPPPSPRLSNTETDKKKRNTDIFYYALKLSQSFQVKWSLIFSLDCQVTAVRKPHALRHNKQPLLKISAPRKNHTPHPRAGWSVTLILKAFWQGREHGRVPGARIKIKIRKRKNSAAPPAIHSPKLQTLKKAPPKKNPNPLIFGVCKPPLTLMTVSEMKHLYRAT